MNQPAPPAMTQPAKAPPADDIRAVLDRMVRRLVAEYAPQRIVLFGSHAGGAPGPDSDIDLLIIKDTPARFLDRWTEAQRILTGMHRAIPVDTLVMTPQEVEERLSKKDPFITQAFEKGEALYVEGDS